MISRRFSIVAVAALGVWSAVPASPTTTLAAQTTPAAASRLVGTIVSSTSSSLTVKPDTGDPVNVALGTGTAILNLPPGSKDLKSAQPASASDLEVNDRVLILLDSSAAAPTARRVLVMKGTAIAAQQQTAQKAWAHSQGGIVETITAADSSFTLKSGTRTVAITTTPTTMFRRYAPGSVRYQDAKPSSLLQLHKGDEVRVRGSSTAESITADEVVFGSFRQIGGELLSIDPANSSVTLRDSSTKQPIVVMLTSHTDIHALPPALAKELAAGSGHGSHPAGAGQEAGSPGPDPAAQISQLPALPLSSLKSGDSVFCVTSDSPDHVHTATLVLSGAAPILATLQSGGGSNSSLSAWNLGGAATPE